jgi:hypothetical protein
MSAKQDSIVAATRYRPTRSRPGEICKDFRHLTNVQTRKALTRAAKGPIHGPCWAHGRPDLSVSPTLQPYLDAGGTLNLYLLDRSREVMMNRSWWGVFSLVALLLTGCATAKSSKLGTAPPEVTTVFRNLSEASGRDSTSVIVSERQSPTINAASAGGSRFIVTSGLVETGNGCF